MVGAKDDEVASGPGAARVAARRRARKLLRTVQSEVPFVKATKEVLVRPARRLLRRPHELEFSLLRAVGLDDDGCFVDVGANRGQSIDSILLYRPDAEIVAFEPNPELAGRLRRRYRSNPRVTIVAEGLGDRPGRATLHVPVYNGQAYDALASFDEEEARSWLVGRVYGFDPRKLTLVTVDCPVTTLDAHGLDPAFLKVDVQGYEYEVLAGGRGTLARSRPALLVEDAWADPRTAGLARGLGYEEHAYDGVTCTKGPSRRKNSLLLPTEALDGTP